MNKTEKKKAKTENAGGTEDGEEAVVKTEVGVRKRIIDLSDKIEGVVAVADDGGRQKCLESLFIIFDLGLDCRGSFQFSPLPRLAGQKK